MFFIKKLVKNFQNWSDICACCPFIKNFVYFILDCVLFDRKYFSKKNIYIYFQMFGYIPKNILENIFKCLITLLKIF